MYYNIRNSTSHPTSTRVSYENARQLVQFIIVSMAIMDSKYFWYVDIDALKEKTTSFIDNLSNSETTIKHNLSDVYQKHNVLLMRESEINDLNKYILHSKRSAGMVILHGYCGVGKTAIASEFCYNVLKENAEGEKTFDFIVWLSLKINELSYDR